MPKYLALLLLALLCWLQLSAQAPAQPAPFRNALRLELVRLASRRQALEYERRISARFAAVFEALHQQHRLSAPGTYEWEYLENVERSATALSTNYQGKTPPETNGFLPERALQLSAAGRAYLTPGKVRLYAQPTLSYFLHWGFRADDERELLSQTVTGCCAPAPLETTVTQSQWRHRRLISEGAPAGQHWGGSLHLGAQALLWRGLLLEMRYALHSNWAMPFKPFAYYGGQKIGHRFGLQIGWAF
jgi:hypothetical protein